jgi:hypothetical protein
MKEFLEEDEPEGENFELAGLKLDEQTASVIITTLGSDGEKTPCEVTIDLVAMTQLIFIMRECSATSIQQLMSFIDGFNAVASRQRKEEQALQHFLQHPQELINFVQFIQESEGASRP